MCESKKDALRVNFDRKLKPEFHGMKVTRNAGLIAYREIDDVSGLTDTVAYELRDNPKGKNTQHSMSRSVQKQVLEEKRGIKKRVFMQIFNKTVSEKFLLTVQGDFGEIIDVVHRKLCLFKSVNGKSRIRPSNRKGGDLSILLLRGRGVIL